MATAGLSTLQLYSTILTTLWSSGYLTTNLNPKQALDLLGYVIYSQNDTRIIAALSGINMQDVNRTISAIYVCVNSTVLTNNTNQFWNW